MDYDAGLVEVGGWAAGTSTTTFPTARLLITFSYALRTSSKAYTESVRGLILPIEVRRGRLEERRFIKWGSRSVPSEMSWKSVSDCSFE